MAWLWCISVQGNQRLRKAAVPGGTGLEGPQETASPRKGKQEGTPLDFRVSKQLGNDQLNKHSLSENFHKVTDLLPDSSASGLHDPTRSVVMDQPFKCFSPAVSRTPRGVSRGQGKGIAGRWGFSPSPHVFLMAAPSLSAVPGVSHTCHLPFWSASPGTPIRWCLNRLLPGGTPSLTGFLQHLFRGLHSEFHGQHLPVNGVQSSSGGDFPARPTAEPFPALSASNTCSLLSPLRYSRRCEPFSHTPAAFLHGFLCLSFCVASPEWTLRETEGRLCFLRDAQVDKSDCNI